MIVWAGPRDNLDSPLIQLGAAVKLISYGMVVLKHGKWQDII